MEGSYADHYTTDAFLGDEGLFSLYTHTGKVTQLAIQVRQITCASIAQWHSVGLVNQRSRVQSPLEAADVIRTRSLLIWSQTRYRCATESAGLRFYYYIQWRSPIQLLTFYDIHNFYQPQYQCHSGPVVRALAHFSCVLCVMSSNPQWV